MKQAQFFFQLAIYNLQQGSILQHKKSNKQNKLVLDELTSL